MSQYTSTAVKNLVLYKYSLVLALTQYVSQSKYGALGLNIVTYLALTPVAVT